eukprot:scaffold6091_cov112-Isochrysis_galbana.AAC.3
MPPLNTLPTATALPTGRRNAPRRVGCTRSCKDSCRPCARVEQASNSTDSAVGPEREAPRIAVAQSPVLSSRRREAP